MTPHRSTVGHLLAAWPVLGTAYRLALVVNEARPVATRGLRLVRAEARLAKESLPVVARAGLAALLGFWVLLDALVAGAVLALVAAGWPLGWAIALPAAIGLAALLVGGLLAWRGVEHLTFVQSRARLHALLEVLDEE